MKRSSQPRQSLRLLIPFLLLLGLIFLSELAGLLSHSSALSNDNDGSHDNGGGEPPVTEPLESDPASHPLPDLDTPLSLPPPSWYSASTRYVLFQPSGGISNQRKILTWALRVCEILERTCILPHVAPHTTWYFKYNEVPLNSLSPAYDVYDVNAMPVPVVSLSEVTLVQFAQGHLNRLGGAWRVVERNSLKEKRASPWNAAEVSRQFGDEAAQFLYLAKGTMWQCFNFSVAEMNAIQPRVPFHPSLRTTARQLSDTLTPYNALHIRFADGEANRVRENWLKPASTFLFRMKLAKFREVSRNLYIATVPSKITHPFFNSIKETYNVSFSTSLPRDLPLLDTFPDPLKSTILGILEQLICARAQKFLGTGFSTFSEHIRTMRRFRVLAQDPTIANTPTEERFLAQLTPCLHELKPC